MTKYARNRDKINFIGTLTMRDRDESIHKSRHIDDDATNRIKIKTPTFVGANDPKTFSDWLANMDFNFD